MVAPDRSQTQAWACRQRYKHRSSIHFSPPNRQAKAQVWGFRQVYGIIKQHNGEIALESKPGKGTTFIIYLPLSSTAEAATIDDDTPIAGHGESVLVVEDNEAMRGALENMLDALGYRVRAAASGIEALAIPHAQLGRLDLLLTDLVMPEMGGIDLYRSIKQIKPTIKALVISGYPM
ncbi:MAG: response regulator [Caldilineaceae bacterium]